MKLVDVPAATIETVWPVAAHLLDRAIAYSNGATSLAKERAALVSGGKQLWLVIDPDNPETRNKVIAAGITSLQNNEDGTRTANIEQFGGENMKVWFSLKDQFEAWAKTEGCKDVRLWGRKGWAKHLPDYKISYYIMQKELA